MTKKITHCPITQSTDAFTFLDLGGMPLVNNLSNTREESLNCKRYPLAVQHFPKSGLSCLIHSVSPSKLFGNYAYKSGVSQQYAEHCWEMFHFVDEYLHLTSGDSVLDIGGNDGTLLSEFLSINPYLDVLNIDPAANLIKLNKVPALNAFWGMETASKLGKKFKLITSTNVFQHTADILDFVKAVSLSLDSQGLWVLEFPYFKTTLETGQYDQVYHEHIYYYTLKPLVKLFTKCGLQIINATPQDIHGGSMRLVISKTGAYPESCINEHLITPDEYKGWGEVVSKHISDSQELLRGLSADGKTLAAFGAAAKGCVFMNAAGVDHTLIEAVIDDTDLKQGKFIPGTGIQIKSGDYLDQNKVDYLIILAHNFKNEIIQSLNGRFKGKYIVCFPKLEII